MSGLHRHLRLSRVALAAIAGMLSLVGEASACSTRPARKAARSCCVVVSTPACCCETPAAETADVPPAAPRAGDGLAAWPPAPCECRPGRPSEPAKKPQPSPPERRTDQDRAEPVVPSVVARPSAAFARVVLPTGRAPERPIYLRTSRLLI